MNQRETGLQVVFSLERLNFLSLSFIFFHSNGLIQLMIYLYFSTLTLCYLIIHKPFKSTLLNWSYLLNELLLVICCIVCIPMLNKSHFKPSAIKNSGYLFILIFLNSIVMNLVLLLLQIILEFKKEKGKKKIKDVVLDKIQVNFVAKKRNAIFN